MTQYSKLNIIYRLQKWMDSVPGQTFLNYAYSWGAAIVILGTLFKLTHIPGANFWLFLGMGTEVFVFFLSAFDRPFDKTADGMDLPTHLNLDNELQVAVPLLLVVVLLALVKLVMLVKLVELVRLLLTQRPLLPYLLPYRRCRAFQARLYYRR